MAHTPAPWRHSVWTRQTDGSKALVIIGSVEVEGVAGDLVLASVASAHDTGSPYTVPKDEAEANWHLMTSAPLLLQALDHLQSRPNDPWAHSMAIAAMKQARGEA